VSHRHLTKALAPIITKSAAESFWALRPAADAAGKIVPMQQTVNA
jgi:hypothetical protein